MPGKFQDPEKTVFVSNVEQRVTEELLWELFLQAGPLINVHIPTDKGTGKNKTFAFITYRSQCSVKYACELFNTLKLFKKPIYCKPTESRGNKVSSSPIPTIGSPNFSTPVRPSHQNFPAIPTPSPQYERNRDIDSYSNSRDRQRNDRDRYGSDYNQRDERDRYGGGYNQRNDRDRHVVDHNRSIDQGGDRNRSYDQYNDRSSSSNYRSNNDRSQGYDNNQRQRYGGSYSPAYQHAMGNSMGHVSRSNSYDAGRGNYDHHSPHNSPSHFGPMRVENDRQHRMNRRQKSQPY